MTRQPTTEKPVVPAGVAEYYLPSTSGPTPRSRRVCSPSRDCISSTKPRGSTPGKRAPGSRRSMTAATSPIGPQADVAGDLKASCRARPRTNAVYTAAPAALLRAAELRGVGEGPRLTYI